MVGDASGEERLRVLLSHIYCWPEHRRGGERYLHELGGFLARAGHQVEIISTDVAPRDEVVNGVPLHVFGRRTWRERRYAAFANEAAFGWQAFRHAARRPIDVWHAASFSDGAAAARMGRLRPGIRTVFTDHGFPVRTSRDKRPDRKLYERVVKDIDAYVCVSAPAAGYLASDYGRQATVVSPGVDVDSFRLGTVRERRPTVLFAGSLSESRKNVPLLLEAADLLMDTHPELQLWLLGQGDATSILKAASDRVHNAVTEVGPLAPDELASRYQRAWVTALPSDAEVFGMVLTESLACGTPGVALDDGLGPSTILTPETGVLADRTPRGLADALSAGLELATTRDIRDAARARAECFDWRRVIVPQLEAVYRGLPA